MIRLFFVLANLTLLSACSSVYAPIAHKVTLEPETSLSTTAVINHTYIRSKSSNYIICTQLSADAAFDQGDDTGITATLTGNRSDGINNQKNANDVEMAGRTPAVLMARELMFRACEFSANYNLSKDEAMKLYNDTLTTIGGVWATEAGNTTVTVGDTVNSTLGTSIQNTESGTITESNSDSSQNN